MAMRWCCDRRSSRLTTLPTALLSLSAASKQPSDAHPPGRHWVPLPEIPAAPGRHCCPRVSPSGASGTHCCYLSRPWEPHSLPAVPLIWTGDKAAFCTKVGVPQGLEALEARHMRERAKEGRGREAEQAHPQQRRPRQAHVDEPVDAHRLRRQCILRASDMRRALTPAHTSARTRSLEEDHLFSKLACSAQLPSCRSRRSMLSSLHLHLHRRRDTCGGEPTKQDDG